VVEELAGTADRLQALAGATMGPLSDIDEARRSGMLEKLGVLVARDGDAIEADITPAALVCFGAVEIVEDGRSLVVRAGEVLFPRLGSDRGLAAASGAILLTGGPSFLTELAAAPPSLASIFAARKA
jgi:hypothetical protein